MELLLLVNEKEFDYLKNAKTPMYPLPDQYDLRDALKARFKIYCNGQSFIMYSKEIVNIKKRIIRLWHI